MILVIVLCYYTKTQLGGSSLKVSVASQRSSLNLVYCSIKICWSLCSENGCLTPAWFYNIRICALGYAGLLNVVKIFIQYQKLHSFVWLISEKSLNLGKFQAHMGDKFTPNSNFSLKA